MFEELWNAPFVNVLTVLGTVSTIAASFDVTLDIPANPVPMSSIAVPSSNAIDFKPVQPEKIFSPIFVTLLGMTNEERAEHLENAKLSIVVKRDGSAVASVSSSPSAVASPLAAVFTPSNRTDVNPVHPTNAFLPIETVRAGIVIVSR